MEFNAKMRKLEKEFEETKKELIEGRENEIESIDVYNEKISKNKRFLTEKVY